MADLVVRPVEHFPDGHREIVRDGNLEVGVFRVDGEFYALPNICIHQFGPLCKGEVTGTLTASEEKNWRREWVHEGEILVCPWHALEFNITTGQCLARPRIKLRSFPVRVEDGKVIVTL